MSDEGSPSPPLNAAADRAYRARERRQKRRLGGGAAGNTASSPGSSPQAPPPFLADRKLELAYELFTRNAAEGMRLEEFEQAVRSLVFVATAVELGDGEAQRWFSAADEGGDCAIDNACFVKTVRRHLTRERQRELGEMPDLHHDGRCCAFLRPRRQIHMREDTGQSTHTPTSSGARFRVVVLLAARRRYNRGQERQRKQEARAAVLRNGQRRRRNPSTPAAAPDAAPSAAGGEESTPADAANPSRLAPRRWLARCCGRSRRSSKDAAMAKGSGFDKLAASYDAAASSRRDAEDEDVDEADPGPRRGKKTIVLHDPSGDNKRISVDVYEADW